ncbi:MAG TPA: hypothetical protein VLX90_02820 [Steroidobacteraceae bacterium]|nr:hypothetical protein [Steroidobacteraceae bacterium]
MKRGYVHLLWLAWVLLAVSAFAEQTISDADARSHVGETATVVGLVANVYTSAKGDTLLNFGQRHPSPTFSAVVFADRVSAFPDLHGLETKEISVTGKIQLYQGRPAIILVNPAQLRQLKVKT